MKWKVPVLQQGAHGYRPWNDTRAFIRLITALLTSLHHYDIIMHVAAAHTTRHTRCNAGFASLDTSPCAASKTWQYPALDIAMWSLYDPQ